MTATDVFGEWLMTCTLIDHYFLNGKTLCGEPWAAQAAGGKAPDQRQHRHPPPLPGLPPPQPRTLGEVMTAEGRAKELADRMASDYDGNIHMEVVEGDSYTTEIVPLIAAAIRAAEDAATLKERERLLSLGNQTLGQLRQFLDDADKIIMNFKNGLTPPAAVAPAPAPSQTPASSG